jgi:hypothetical protein
MIESDHSLPARLTNMKKLLLLPILMLAGAANAVADVSVSIDFAQPGVYGHVDIGGLPAPRLYFRDPLRISPVRIGVVLPPIYLYVPYDHARHWSRHCREYRACDRPVYFIHEAWYNDVYMPHHGHDEYRHRRDYRHEYDRDYRRRHDHDRGAPGNSDWGHEQGRKNGHGRGKDDDRRRNH